MEYGVETALRYSDLVGADLPFYGRSDERVNLITIYTYTQKALQSFLLI